MKEKIIILVDSLAFNLAKGIIFILIGIGVFFYMIVFKENDHVNILPLIIYLFSTLIFFPKTIVEIFKDEKRHF